MEPYSEATVPCAVAGSNQRWRPRARAVLLAVVSFAAGPALLVLQAEVLSHGAGRVAGPVCSAHGVSAHRVAMVSIGSARAARADTGGIDPRSLDERRQ